MRAIALGLSLLHAGCLIQTVTTDVEFRDPAQVELATADKTVIARGSGETSAPLTTGRVESSDASAAYGANAVRTGDGSLWIEWTTKLPLENGERTRVLGSEPMTFTKPLAALFAPEALEAPRFALSLCATIAYRRSRYSGAWHADARGTDGECLGSAVLPYRIETDWSNVVIHEKTRVEHGLAWMTIALSLLTLAPFALVVDLAHPRDIAGGVPTQVGFTIGIGAVIAAFSGSMIPTLLASDRDVYVRR